MANEQNLKPLNTRTQRERKEIARKGAEATNKIIAERKTLSEELRLLLGQLTDKNITVQESITVALVGQAKRGNTKAFEIIRDTIGEKPSENLNLKGDIDGAKCFAEYVGVLKNGKGFHEEK